MGRLSDAINAQHKRAGGSRLGSSGVRVSGSKYSRPVADRIVLGHDVLDATLRGLDTAASNRIARSGLGKSVRVIAKAIKAQVPAGEKGIRSAIGSRVGLMKGENKPKGVTEAKAGAAVGRAPWKAASKQKAKVKGTGVGISANNIHWWILGATGKKAKNVPKGSPRKTKTGARRGIMPPQKPIVKLGYSASSSAAIAALREGTVTALSRELAKKHKKK